MYRGRHTDADNRRPKISAGAEVPAARRSDSIARSVLQSCPVTGEGGSIVLVRIRLGFNLAMEHSASDGGVGQHEGQDKETLSPEHESEAGMWRCRRVNRDRKRNHVRSAVMCMVRLR